MYVQEAANILLSVMRQRIAQEVGPALNGVADRISELADFGQHQNEQLERRMMREQKLTRILILLALAAAVALHAR